MESYYEIVGMKRDDSIKGRWRFVARPLPQPEQEFEFECHDPTMEAIVWARAWDNVAVRMWFAKQDNGKWLIKRIGD